MIPALLRATLLVIPVLSLVVGCSKKSSDDGPPPPPPAVAISMVSVASDGVTVANATCSAPAMSADGNIIAFTSTATNLAGATGGNNCIFIKNMSSGVLTMLLGDGGLVPNNDCANPSISDDGRYVAFDTGATNIDNGTTIPGPFSNIYVHDRNFGTNTLISHQAVATTGANQNSTNPTISAAGGFVVFQSAATDLTAIATANQIYRATIAGASLTTVSRDGATGTVAANNTCTSPDVSSDGRYISYQSNATNIDAAKAVGTIQDIFVCDFTLLGAANSSKVVSRNDGLLGAVGNADTTVARISDDGLVVVFMSLAGNFNEAFGGAPHDVFIRNWTSATPVTSRVSKHSDGSGNGNSCNQPEISATGRFVQWHSSSNTFVTGDAGFRDVFRHDFSTHATIRVSEPAGGGQGDADTFFSRSAMTPDGLFHAFPSPATNLVSSPTPNAVVQIYRKGSY